MHAARSARRRHGWCGSIASSRGSPPASRRHSFRPAEVSDRSDGKIAHLDGLNLSRAWCFRTLAAALPQRDARRAPMITSAEEHLIASLPHVSDDYAGSHWLATYAVLALSAGNDGRA